MGGYRQGAVLGGTLHLAVGEGAPRAVRLADAGPEWPYLGGLLLGSATGGGRVFLQQVAAAVSLRADWRLTEAYGWLAPVFAPGTAHVVVYSSADYTPGRELYARRFSVPGPRTASPDWYGASRLDWVLPAGCYWVAFEVRPEDTFSGLIGRGAAAPVGNEAAWSDTAWPEAAAPDEEQCGAGPAGLSPHETGMMTLLGSGLIGLSLAAHGWQRT